jgi:poly-gamma-glutamate synthesis protein (capsule biosynthesis protein)
MIKKPTIWLILSIFLVIVFGIFWVNIYRLNNGQDESWHLFSYQENLENLNIDVGNNVRNNEDVAVEEESINFLFFGDVMLDRNVSKVLENKTTPELLEGLQIKSDYFINSDIVGANLEGVVTNNGEHYAPINLYDFAFAADKLSGFKDLGFNYFALSNNHFLDQGSRGVKETRENLEANSFYFSGSPDSEIDTYSRKDIKIKEKNIAMISLSMVYKHFDREQAKNLISLAAVETDLVVVNIHWGNEYEHFFNVYQQQIGHFLIDSGADMVIGHHPHVVQGMEVYNNRPIFYSLGNFIFDQYFSVATQTGLAVSVVVQDDMLVISLLPFTSKLSAPIFISEKEAHDKFLVEFISFSDVSDDIAEELKTGKLQLSL